MRIRIPSVPGVALALACSTLLVLARPGAGADSMQPDPSLREALLMQRLAARDTIGFAGDVGRLDSLGVALLRIGRFAEARQVLGRVLALAPADDAARAGLGKLALFRDDLAAADSLLVGPARAGDPDAASDLLAARVRAGRWAEAAELSEAAGQPGRADQLRQMGEQGVYAITAGPEQGEVMFARSWPAPLVSVRLNGQSVLMAVDTGTDDLVLDESIARGTGVAVGPSQHMVFWNGARAAVRNAWVARLEIAGFRIEKLPAGCLSLRKWSLEVNPQSERVAGIIGLGLLRRFTPTLDFARQRLVLRRPGVAFAPAAGAQRVPFELWGENELMVWGSISGGRRLAMVVQTGVPACGLGAPQEVCDEFGLRAGPVARAMKSAGTWIGGRPWIAVTVPAVNVGRVATDKVPGWIGALDSSELWRHGVRRDALLSHAFFRGRRVTIDWSAHELVIEDKP